MPADPSVRSPRRGGPPGSRGPASGWRWHAAALAVLGLAALWNAWDWLALDRMPPGDFPGYAAELQRVRDALLGYGRVPSWCGECYGGTSRFTGNLKEILFFPLALVMGPVLATKLAFLILKGLSGFGLYWLVARAFAAPAAGLVAGYALAFGAVANHQLEHLDAALATALLPPTLWVAHELLRRGGAGYAVALGALAAAQLANNWVYALSVPLLVGVLTLFAPWRDDVGAPHPWRARGAARRGLARVAAALTVFAVLAASTLTWVAADAPNHRLRPELSSARQRHVYVERSPFLFVNRANVLGPWLAEHQPPGFDLAESDGGRRYLGVVVLAVVAVGLWPGRGARIPAPRRRWAALAATLFGIHYWLALGPHTLLWEVGESLHWSATAQAGVRGALLAASAALALTALARRLRTARAGDGSGRGARRALIASLLVLAPTCSLWSGLALVFPPLEVQRSPGHFFATVPLWLSLLFAVALTELARRVSRPRRAYALIAAVGVAVVIDFAPSRRPYAAGTSRDALERVRAMVASLPGEGGSLRIGLPIAYFPLASWVLAQAEAGYAWGWLPWQSGRHWPDLYVGATYAARGPGPEGGGALAPDLALLRAARIRYLLLPSAARMPAPWRRLDAAGRFALWQGPAVAPPAQAFGSTLWLRPPAPGEEAALAARALRANTLLVSEPGDPADPALAVLRETAAARIEAGAAAPEALPVASAPVPVAMRRPAPERIALEVDAGDAPAVVSLAEGHHPWWRAEVDGRPAPVLRANVAMLAVPVGPGRHEIALRFAPPFRVAAADAVSAAGWLAVALAGVAVGIRSLRGPAPDTG